MEDHTDSAQLKLSVTTSVQSAHTHTHISDGLLGLVPLRAPVPTLTGVADADVFNIQLCSRKGKKKKRASNQLRVSRPSHLNGGQQLQIYER